MRHLALLHSVVPAGRRVRGADLPALARDAGVVPVRCMLGTGALILTANQHAAARETGPGQALQRCLGKAIRVFVRTAPDWPALIAANPVPNPRRA